MGKAIVLKNVNFAINKLDTVTFGDIVPCTGVVLSQNSITFTELNATVQLNAVKTPANTTDELVWTSSDTDVVTVSDGLVTCVGVGSAEITVTCGTQTATCSVSATVTIVPDVLYYAENGGNYSGSLDLTATPPKNHIGYATNTRARLYYSTENILGGYRVFVYTAQAGKYAIPIPKGTKFITVTPPDGLRSYQYLVLANSMEKQTYVSGADGESALGIKAWASNSSTSYPKTYDISEYPDADSFILVVDTPAGGDASTVSGTTTVTFS